MCWGIEASATFTVLGTGVVAYGLYRKDAPQIIVAVATFTIIEFLQTLQYIDIDQCSSRLNQTATYLTWVNISAQPLVLNYLFLYFIDDGVRKRIQVPVLSIAAVCSLLNLAFALPLPGTAPCEGGFTCADQFCAYSGEYHLGWLFGLNDFYLPSESFRSEFSFLGPLLNRSDVVYYFPVMILPLLYGSWKAVLFVILTGPAVFSFFIDDRSEALAVWCLFAVPLFLVAVYKPSRQIFFVKRWPFWPKQWRTAPSL